MKQLTLELKKRLLIVEGLPENYEIGKGGIFFRKQWTHENDYIEGSFQLICKGYELTEEIAKGLVGKKQVFVTPSIFNYINYKSEFSDCLTALESFISAIEANGFWWSKNPIEKPDFMDGSYDDNGFGDVNKHKYKKEMLEWQEAESHTFNPEKCIIFEIL